MIGNFPFITCAILIALGIYALMFKRNLIKIVIGMVLIEAGVNLFLITIGYKADSIAPIFTYASKESMVLPTVQALTLTNIVIGFAVNALLLSFIIMIYRHYKTIDSREVRRLRG